MSSKYTYLFILVGTILSGIVWLSLGVLGLVFTYDKPGAGKWVSMFLIVDGVLFIFIAINHYITRYSPDICLVEIGNYGTIGRPALKAYCTRNQWLKNKRRVGVSFISGYNAEDLAVYYDTKIVNPAEVEDMIVEYDIEGRQK